MSWSRYWQHMELVKNRRQLLNIFKIIFLTIVKDQFSFKVWLYPTEVFCFFSFSTSFSVCRLSWAHDSYKGPQTRQLVWWPLPHFRLEVKSSFCHHGLAGHQRWWGPAAYPPATDPSPGKLTCVLRGRLQRSQDRYHSLAWTQGVAGRCHPVWRLLLMIQVEDALLTFSVSQSVLYFFFFFFN